MKIKIKNFKSIRNAELELAPLTILIGPPASGKSNILDAIALLGYFYRILRLSDEYNNDITNLEPLTIISRFNNIEQIFRNNDISEIISIEAISEESNMIAKIFYEKAMLTIQINNSHISWDMKTLNQHSVSIITNAIKKHEEKMFEGRIYGYERYGLTLSSCSNYLNCGFHLRLKNKMIRGFPKYILSEFGWNAPYLIRRSQDLIISLNYYITEKLGEKIEVKVSKTGSIVIYDYHVEVDVSGVSDSIFRILYYLLALRSAINYVKFYGLEKRFIIMFEEPEAHVFPFFIMILTDYITKAVKNMYVVITTHNPILVSALWDRVKDVKTYYVLRNKLGSTNVVEIDVSKLAEELVTSEDLLLMSPHEVLKKYVARK